MKYLFFLIFVSINTFSQQFLPDNRIVVLGNSSVELPADQVLVKVQLKYEDLSTPQKVYDKHKLKENELVRLFKELNIPEKNIKYSLLNVTKSTDYNSDVRKIYFETDQSIDIQLDSINQYTKFTLKLLEKGFSGIQAEFTSSKGNQFKAELIEKAVEAAKMKANVMAKVSNRKVGKVLKIGDTEEIDSIFGYNYYLLEHGAKEMKFDKKNNSQSFALTNIRQTVTYYYNVKVVFELE